MVVGPVGAGKSSLLSTILGELESSSGSLRKAGSLAYVSQEAWVFPASLRENVLFGAELQADWYQEVLRCCGLVKDLEQLSHGDASLVGDRGIRLSGGQKARLSLARAVYRDADIYLLDDPLSAVDAAVGRYLFRQCIRGQLRGKLVVLVTHHLQYLPEADHILLLKNGSVAAAGSYAELQQLGDRFTSICQQTLQSHQCASRHDAQFQAWIHSSIHISFMQAPLPGN